MKEIKNKGENQMKGIKKLTKNQKTAIKWITAICGVTLICVTTSVVGRKIELDYLSKKITKQINNTAVKDMHNDYYNAGKNYALAYIYNNIPDTRQPLYDYSQKCQGIFAVPKPNKGT